MGTIRSAIDRDVMTARLDRLTPELRAQWGRFTVPRMLAHMSDACRLGLGELQAARKKLPFIGSFPLKHLVIHVMPFPKNAPTAPEMIARTPLPLHEEREELKTLLVRLGHLNAPAVHPLFGMLTPEEWGVLTYRHLDHHLRQFGV